MLEKFTTAEPCNLEAASGQRAMLSVPLPSKLQKIAAAREQRQGLDKETGGRSRRREVVGST
jgi:hypothetical protein